MKAISRRFHAILDYGSVIILLLAPFLFNFVDVPTAKMIVIVAAAFVLLLSFMTQYEGGLVKIIPMRMHLAADIALGLFLIASPWLFKFNNETYLFHVIIGLVALLAGVFTNGKSVYKHQRIK